ncbi:Aste57867_17690 [Aphanomyces stellatus]|uniref:Aste57867_17690 protein n=1 Tax=Aphanomyces stellatus TaxID=120398 RepID=A0A485LA38_9STRA|nr:hypothetical protein As57867_017629 [Aphanomyces stellatus]VFT94440.1 Aste57867_17690 [Aphanomyces stellatus]
MGPLLLLTYAVLSITLIADASNASPLNVALELSDVRFDSQADAFRVQLTLSDGDDLPLRIWLESKRSKAQWAVLVTDIQSHAPEGANYVLPTAVVVSAMQQGFSVLATDGNVDSNGCDIKLVTAKNNHLRLVVELKAFSMLSARYEFDLLPLSIEKIDVLGAKIRDLEDDLPAAVKQMQMKIRQVETELAARVPVSLALTTTADTSVGYFLGLSKRIPILPQDNYFKLASDTKIVLKRPGQYLIQARGTISHHYSHNNPHFRLYVDDVYVWTSAPIVSDTQVWVIQLTHTIVASKNTEVKIGYATGSGPLPAGANVTIVLQQELTEPNESTRQTCASNQDCT